MPAGTSPGVVTIPFADWRRAPRDTADADRRITPDDLGNLGQFTIFVNQVEGNPVVRGSFVVDDTRATQPSPSPPGPCHDCRRWVGLGASDPRGTP